MSTKDRILGNPFTDKLRIEMQVDEAAYRDLCDQLVKLATEWRSEDFVDKQLMQELYVLSTIIRGVADSVRGHKPDVAAELDNMSSVIDGLITEALA